MNWGVFVRFMIAAILPFLVYYYLSGYKPIKPEKVVNYEMIQDVETGCQYLILRKTGLTPRLSINGDHIGCVK